jgi:dTDP-4-amino-4,6-dideoxygalactose transaminase
MVKKEAYLKYLDMIDESRVYSNYGPLNTLFEERVLAEYFDNQGAVTTVNNATTGLMTAISTSKRQKGCYAVMPSFTFAATPLAAMWCGLKPYFIDIRLDDWCMDEELLKDELRRLGDDVAVVIPYATFGTHLNLDYYHDLHLSGIPVVVDAAASFGTFGENGQFGKVFPGVVVYSFHATKSFGIGEGGLVYSGDREIIPMIRRAGNFGFSERRESVMLGLNGKLSEYGAAITLATLDVFQGKIGIRQQINTWYIQHFEQAGLLNSGWSFQKTKGRIAHQFMSVLCPEGEANETYVESLSDCDIQARTYFSPACHQQPLFKSYPYTKLSVTEDISGRILSLPLWEEMVEGDVNKVVNGICR